MSTPIITVDYLSKRYQLGQIGATTLRESVERFVNRVRLRKTLDHRLQTIGQEGDSSPLAPSLKSIVYSLESDPQDFWALRDVSFEVQPGEVLGIIGRNGAGKSTLLKILSRITEPTSGRAIIRGRVASLLEVGTGFHPELSGRENIFLNGAILGMKRTEIARKFDEIVAFAEVEKFIDTPVKHYSSGMYVRLAFAVAAHLEPEILVVDEVLAVGDVQFQKKCLGKMQDVAKHGRTVLFVSHNITAVKTLCQRAILLQGGRVVADGEVERVVGEYTHSHLITGLTKKWEDPEAMPGNEKVQIVGIQLVIDDPTKTIVDVDTPFHLQFDVMNHQDGAALNLSVAFYTSEDVCVFNTTSPVRDCPTGLLRGECYVPSGFLNDIIYRVQLAVVQDSKHIFNDTNIFSFEVGEIQREGAWFGKWMGIVRPKLEWNWGCAKNSDHCG